MQSNLHRVSESALASKAGTEQKKERSCRKRLREPEPETKTSGSFMAETLSTGVESNYLISKEESEVTDACFDQNACISFDDDEGPYETAVEKYSIFFRKSANSFHNPPNSESISYTLWKYLILQNTGAVSCQISHPSSLYAQYTLVNYS